VTSRASFEWPPFSRIGKDGVELDISVVPNAKRTEVVGLHDGALRLRLHAPPVDGKANDALLRWLSDRLALGRSNVELLRGHAARRKTVMLRVEASPELIAALRALLP
jgi:uncharacterized protein (TIGR00251 family)